MTAVIADAGKGTGITLAKDQHVPSLVSFPNLREPTCSVQVTTVHRWAGNRLLGQTHLEDGEQRHSGLRTWADADHVPSLWVPVGQHSDKAWLQDGLYCRWLQVTEHLWPGPPAGVVVHQELERSIVIKLPGSEEPQQKSIVQARCQGGIVLAHHISECLHVTEPPFRLLLELLPGFGDKIRRQGTNILWPVWQELTVWWRPCWRTCSGAVALSWHNAAGICQKTRAACDEQTHRLRATLTVYIFIMFCIPLFPNQRLVFPRTSTIIKALD